MKNKNIKVEIGNRKIGISLTKGNLRDFEKIEELVTMKDLYSCFFCCSNDALKVPGKEHRKKRDNVKEFILNKGNAGVLYPSVTYGTQPNEFCLYYLKKNGLGSYYGWFDVFIVLYERHKQELKEWLLKNEDNL